jgi:aldose 1-epimerase
MDFIIENEYLKVTVGSYGAQLKSVVRKSDNVEHMWQADPAVWGYHAPILFPYTGRVKDNKILAKGREFTDAPSMASPG